MSIDWITVIAQIANFLVLVWLLKHFLYQPILKGIDAREAEIALRMGEAGAAQKKAEAAEAEFQKQQAQLQLKLEAASEQALRVSEKERDSMLEKARLRLEKEQKDWQAHRDLERRKFTSRLRQAGSRTLLELTRKALHDLADETLEQAMVRSIGQRLQPMADELARAAGDSREAVATSRNPLTDKAQAQLTADVQALLPAITVRFETDTGQPAGLTLRVGGAQVAWTIDSYIDELSTRLDEQLAADLSGRRPRDGA